MNNASSDLVVPTISHEAARLADERRREVYELLVLALEVSQRPRTLRFALHSDIAYVSLGDD